MMAMYFVKQDLPGVQRGRVERFAIARAAYLRDFVEPYDEKKHGNALRKQEREDAERRQAAEESLKLERENPAAYQAREMARRAVAVKAAIDAHKARVKERKALDEKAEQ